jgi:hypothetical protein
VWAKCGRWFRNGDVAQASRRTPRATSSSSRNETPTAASFFTAASAVATTRPAARIRSISAVVFNSTMPLLQPLLTR